MPVIELFVKVGDTIAVDDRHRTLESDKATMDVPPRPPRRGQGSAGCLGDKVGEGAVLIRVEAAGAVRRSGANREHGAGLRTSIHPGVRRSCSHAERRPAPRPPATPAAPMPRP